MKKKMSRLTRKTNIKNNLKNCYYYENINNSTTVDVYNKLGKLEDLEDELGCPLETIIEATTNGIIDFEGKKHEVVFAQYYLFVVEEDELRHAFALKNYRKSWWLPSDKEWKDE